MPEMLSTMMHYVLLNISSTTFEYLLISKVFPRRGLPILWYAFFIIKAAGDVILLYPSMTGAVVPEAESLAGLWAAVTGVLALAVISLSFLGDYVLVCTCAIVCDPLMSAMTTFSWLLASHLTGRTGYESYAVPLGTHTVIHLVIFGALYALFRKPIERLLHLMVRSAQQHRAIWAVFVILMPIIFIGIGRQIVNYTSLSRNFDNAIITFCVMLAFIAILLLHQGRQLRRSRKMLQECLALSQKYDATIREQLEQLERDRLALQGHEAVLQQLRTQKNDLITSRIEQLEQAYKRMSAGTYCEQPALDAVLTAAHQRLSDAGAEATFTVAGIPPSSAVPVMAVLATLNLACEAAQRAFNHGDGQVNLRIRYINGQVLMHLDVPYQWGALWARRYLPLLDPHDAGLVLERREGDRRIVLVMCEGSQP